MSYDTPLSAVSPLEPDPELALLDTVDGYMAFYKGYHLGSDPDFDRRLQYCWHRGAPGSCNHCLSSMNVTCGWCPQSQICIPADGGIFTPLNDYAQCPGKNERYDIRAAPFGCAISAATIVASVISIIVTALFVGTLFASCMCCMAIRARRQLALVKSAGSDEANQPGPWWSQTSNNQETEYERRCLLDGSQERDGNPERRPPQRRKFKTMWYQNKKNKGIQAAGAESEQGGNARAGEDAQPRDANTNYGTTLVDEEYTGEHTNGEVAGSRYLSGDTRQWKRGTAKRSADSASVISGSGPSKDGRNGRNRERAIGPTQASIARISGEYARVA